MGVSVRLSVPLGLSTNLVNEIQTESFWLGPSNLVHLLLMTSGRYLSFLRSGVKGQSHTLSIVFKPCKQDKDWTVSTRTVKLGIHTSNDKRSTPIALKGQESEVKITAKHCSNLYTR